MIVTISSALQKTLVDEAAVDPDREVCGLLLGRTAAAITGAVSARNVAADPARSFEIDPATLLRVHREARGQGQAVIGHYHSHPNGNGNPSKRDAARALENGQLWLIIAADAVHGWRAVADAPDALHGCFRAITVTAISGAD